MKLLPNEAVTEWVKKYSISLMDILLTEVQDENENWRFQTILHFASLEDATLFRFSGLNPSD